VAFDVGNIRIDPPCVLAPMEGITNREFRMLVRGIGGCGLTVTEFVSSEGLTRNVTKAWQMATLDPDERPVSIQIYGRDPARMAEAARVCAGLHASIVDVNLGCPSKRVTSGCAGSALMREPERARDIFAAVAEALAPSGLPFTVKMRTGWDDAHRNAPDIAAMAEAAGARMVAVHGRTRCDGFKNKADWGFVARVKDAVRVPVLANGDILTVDDARRALELSRADGVMVGRGVMRNPWLLAQIAQSLRGQHVREPSLTERRDVLLGWLDRIGARCALDVHTLGQIKKVAGYFTRGLPWGARVREAVWHAGTAAEARAHLADYFATLDARGTHDAFLRIHDEDDERAADAA
jgi:nifR3 family TIM-barrel protein